MTVYFVIVQCHKMPPKKLANLWFWLVSTETGRWDLLFFIYFLGKFVISSMNKYFSCRSQLKIEEILHCFCENPASYFFSSK